MKKNLFFSVLFFAAASLFAQNDEQADLAQAAETGGDSPKTAVPVKTLTIDEAVSLAIVQNLNLEAVGIGTETKKRAADFAWNNFLPTVGFSGGLSAANTAPKALALTPSGPTMAEGSRWTMNGALQIQWQGLNIAMIEGIKKIREDYTVGALSFQKAKIQLEREIRKLYLQILLLEENLKVQEQNLQLAEQNFKMSDSRYRAGLSSELTLLQARVDRDRLIPAVNQVNDNIKIARANLAVQLGLPYDTEFKLMSVDLGNFDVSLDVQELIAKAAGNKPDIMELQANITATKSARTALALQTWTPNLNIGWNVTPTNSDPFGSTSTWTDRGSLSLSLNWALNGLLPFTKEGNAIKNMDDTLKTLDINLAQMIRGAEVEVYNTVFTINQARSSAETQQKTVDLAQRTYELTSQAFQAGLTELLQLSNAQNQLSQAQVGVLQQRFNFLIGIIDLEYAIGAPFGTLMKKQSAN
ncbi:MAG: TolC family protein [Spirochaetaceae bacterium]|jgi:outer membrane protein TolC|nr:TolC family protein [Spirochaetaceae bacterium]